MPSTELDTRTIEELDLDWEIPCQPVNHACDRAAVWDYTRTNSCGCQWDVFYCALCADAERAIDARFKAPSLCLQCRNLVASITCSWRPLHG